MSHATTSTPGFQPRQDDLANRLTREQVGRVMAGVSVLACTALAVLHDPLWLVPNALIAFNVAQSGLTERCLVKSVLARLGFPGEREVGMHLALRERGGRVD